MTTAPADDQLATRIDQLLAARIAALGAAAPSPAAAASHPMTFGAMMPAGAQAAQPMPTTLLARCSIPTPDGRELSGYLAFEVPAELRTPQGVQMLAAQIAATWPVQSFQPRQNGWGGGNYQQRGGYGAGNGGGYRGGGRSW